MDVGLGVEDYDAEEFETYIQLVSGAEWIRKNLQEVKRYNPADLATR